MRKRFIFICILILMTASAVYADGAQISVEISDRDEYYVTAKISENPGFASAQFELFYDTDAAECVEIIPGEIISSMMIDYNTKTAEKTPRAILSTAGTENTTENGDIATFVFKKLTNANPRFDFAVSELRAYDGQTIDCEIIINNRIETDQDSDTAFPQETSAPKKHSSSGSIPQPHKDETTFPTSSPTPMPLETSAPTNIPGEMPEAVVVFTDVPSTHWASAFIREAAEYGLVSGYPDGTFLPENDMTRAEFTTILWNMHGGQDTPDITPFIDVTEDKWFYKQVVWCYNQGFIMGVTDTEFLPDEKITREQAMTILYRAAGLPETGRAIDKFDDNADISDFALPAMNWAVENEIILGVSETRIEPKANATRAQLATIIIKFMKAINRI